MKPQYLVFFLIFAELFAFQAYSLRTRQQVPIQEKAVPFINRKAFKLLFHQNLTNTTDSYDYKDPVAKVASLLQYYIDDTVFSNLVHEGFTEVDEDHSGFISKDEYERIFRDEGVSQEDSDRLWNMVQRDVAADTLDFAEFRDMVEIIFDESLAIVTYVFITGSTDPTPNTGVSLEALLYAFDILSRQMRDTKYPAPAYEDIEFIFRQCDLDQDGQLNLQEFFYCLSIFLRYYKAGIENNAFSQLILRDNLFELFWYKERLEAEHLQRLQSFQRAFKIFFKLAVSEKLLTQVAHVVFSEADADTSGNFQENELRQALYNFGVSDEEVSLLYSFADTDQDGNIDFGEFLTLFETFVHRATARFGYFYIMELGGDVDLNSTFTVFYAASRSADLDPIPDATFTSSFDTMDTDDSGTLDIAEFSQITSGIISYYKAKERDTFNKELEARSGLAATLQTVEEVSETKQDEATAASSDTAALADEILRDLGTGQLRISTPTIEEPPFNYTNQVQPTNTSGNEGTTTYDDQYTGSGDEGYGGDGLGGQEPAGEAESEPTGSPPAQ